MDVANEKYFVDENLPAAEHYARLRESLGLVSPELEAIETALVNSLYVVSILFKGEMVGCGRVIGDGVSSFIIQEILVQPAHQQRGVDQAIMETMLSYLEAQSGEGSLIGAICDQHTADFFERFSFHAAPGPSLAIYHQQTAQDI